MFDPNLRTFDSGDLDGTDKHAELDKYSTQDQNTIPPGSSESFNQFKDRILSAMVGLQSTNQGRAAVVTHSKNIGVMNAWEHAGYPEDQGIHQPTYDDRDSIKPGGHEELEIPSHVIEGLFGIHNQDQSTNMEDVFTRGARQIAGGVIHGSRLHTEGREESPGLEGNPENLPQHEADTEISGPTKSYKIAEDPQRKLMGMVGPMRGEGGGTSSGKGEPHTSSGEPISVIKHPEMETSSQQQAGTNVNKYVHGYFQSGGEGHTIIRQMLKDGATQKEVAAELGITIPRVSQIIKNNNLNYSPDPNKKFPNRIVDTDKLKELFNKREESLKPPFTKKPTTWDDIGKELGVSGTGAYLQAQRLGLVKPANPKLKSGEPDWLVDELGLKK